MKDTATIPDFASWRAEADWSRKLRPAYWVAGMPTDEHNRSEDEVKSDKDWLRNIRGSAEAVGLAAAPEEDLDTAIDLETMLAVLNDHQQVFLTAVLNGDANIKQLAKKTRLHRNTVRNVLNRARAELRARFPGYFKP